MQIFKYFKQSTCRYNYDINVYISGVEETKRVDDSISILGQTEFINVTK